MGVVEPTSRRLNLGSGADYRDDWHNVDVSDDVDPDQCVDLDETPWPWPANHFEHVEARHVFEHLADPVDAFSEVARVLVDGGTFEFVFPIGHTRYEDPTHRHFWNWHSGQFVAGDRKHPHELDVALEIVDQSYEWQLSQVEPLVWLYTWYRLLLRKPGPWLGQVPGLYGEVSVVFEHIAE